MKICSCRGKLVIRVKLYCANFFKCNLHCFHTLVVCLPVYQQPFCLLLLPSSCMQSAYAYRAYHRASYVHIICLMNISYASLSKCLCKYLLYSLFKPALLCALQALLQVVTSSQHLSHLLYQGVKGDIRCELR